MATTVYEREICSGDKLYRSARTVYDVAKGDSNYLACVDEIFKCAKALNVRWRG